MLVASSDGGSQAHLDAEPLERPARVSAQAFVKYGQHMRPRFDECDLGAARIDATEVADKRMVRELRDRARKLHARRSRADDHELQKALTRRRVGSHLGPLECHEDLAPDQRGIVDAFQARRDACPVVMAEIRMSRARREDEIVELDLAAAPEDAAASRVDADDLVHEHGRLFLLAQDRARGPGDIGRRQCGNGDLVQERLEQVIVVPIDYGDVGRDTASARAANRPPKPAPTMTTFGRATGSLYPMERTCGRDMPPAGGCAGRRGAASTNA